MRHRLLIVGAGKMGREHLAAFRACRDTEVVGIISRGGDSARALAAANGVVHAGVDLDEAVARTKPTLAVVAAAHRSSEELVRRCLDHGLHVLAEKPVAFSSAGARQLAGRAAGAGLVACAAVNRRFYPGLLDGYLRLVSLGPPRHLSLVISDSPEERRAFARQTPDLCDHWFLMNTVHAVDLVRMMAGEPLSVAGSRHRRPDRDCIVAHIFGSRGVQASFSLTGGPNLPWSLRLSGDGGALVAEPLEHATLVLGRGDPAYVVGHPEPPGLKMGLHGQARAFLDAIDSGAAPFPLSTLADHAESLRLCEELLALPEPS